MIKTLSKTSLLFAAAVAVSALVGAPAQGAAPQRCIIAAQCKGPIFELCMFCASTGKMGCAHHVCIHHTCQVQICPEFKPYTPWQP